MIERYDRQAGTLALLGYVVALAAASLFWTTSSWPIGELMRLSVPTWVSPLLLAQVIEFVVLVGGFLLISRLSAWQIGLRWSAFPGGLVGGVLVWALAQAIALGPVPALTAARSATPLLLTVPEAPGLLLAYAAVGVLEETEFRGILLGQISARLRGATGTGVAVVVALLASTAVFALVHVPSLASFGWTDLTLLQGALQEVAIMGLALGLCYALTGNLVFAIVVHVLFNSGELVLLAPVEGPAAHPFVVAALIVALAWGGLRWLHARSESELGLIGLLLWLGFFGVALAGLEQLAGWPIRPALPEHLPSWASVQVWLNSPLAGLETEVSIALDLGWVVWGLTAASVLLQALVDLLDAATRGAAWVRSLRVATNWLVLPPIRRAVDASLSGLLLARVLVQPAAAAEASSVPVAGIVMMAPADAQRPGHVSDTDAGVGRFAAEIAAPARVDQTDATSDATLELIYTVQRGDTISALGLRFLGDPDTGGEIIFQANQGRPQPDGRVFNRRGLIFPGWTLRIPNPTEGIERAADGTWWYTVQVGDTMSGICAQLLGDPNRSSEVFELNRGAKAPNGHILLNPNLIWAGLRLQIPVDGGAGSVDQKPTPAAAAAAEPPAETAPTTQPTPTQSPAMTATPVPTTAPTSALAQASPAVVVSPAATAAAADATPASAEPPATETRQPAADLAPVLATAVGAVGAAMALGALGLAGVRRQRRRRTTHHATDIPLAGGFAAPTGEEQLYEAQATDLASSVLAELHAAGCAPQSTRLIGTYAGRSGASLLLLVADDQANVLSQAARNADARAKQVAPGLYAWEQSWPPDGPRPMAASDQPQVNLVPLGLAADHRVLYAERSAAGPLLVAGERSAGVYDLLEYLAVDEARRKLPDALYLLTIGAPTRLSPELAGLPHQRAGIVDPADTAAVEQLLDELRSELERRLQTGQSSSPDVLLVVDEWADLPSCGSLPDLLAAHGSAVGIRMIAATTCGADEALDAWVTLFTTRLVLRVGTEAASVRLLGEPGAEDLDWVGQLWPRLCGHVLPRIRGFRISPAYLEVLVEQMRRQAGSQALVRPTAVGDLADEQAEVPDNDDIDDVALVVDTPARLESDVDNESIVDRKQGSAHASIVSQQLALIRAVAVPPARSSTSPAPNDAVVVAYRVLGGHQVVANGQPVQPEITYRLAWEVGAAIAALPPGEASTDTLCRLIWPRVPRARAIRRLRAQVSNLRQFWRAHLGDDIADHILLADGSGVYAYNPNLVSVDLHGFLRKAWEGDRARHAVGYDPARATQAIAAYQEARSLYGGLLLQGTEQHYAWPDELPDELAESTLREHYQREERRVVEALADMLRAAGRVPEAIPLYHDLLAEPGPPDGEREEDQVREAHACALFACYAQLGDLEGLLRAGEELQASLARLDADGGIRTPSRPSEATLARFEAIRDTLVTAGASVGD